MAIASPTSKRTVSPGRVSCQFMVAVAAVQVRFNDSLQRCGAILRMVCPSTEQHVVAR